MTKTYGVKLSQQFLTEAIYSCRGKDMDISDPENSYDLKKLVSWIQKQLPHLYNLEQLSKNRNQKSKITRNQFWASNQNSGRESI